MMTPDAMEEMINELLRRGFDRATAEDYAARIGDTPEEADDGKWIIRDDGGREIARIEPIIEE